MARTNRHLTLPENVKRKDDTSKNAEGLHEKLIMQQEREKKVISSQNTKRHNNSCIRRKM